MHGGRRFITAGVAFGLALGACSDDGGGSNTTGVSTSGATSPNTTVTVGVTLDPTVPTTGASADTGSDTADTTTSTTATTNETTTGMTTGMTTTDTTGTTTGMGDCRLFIAEVLYDVGGDDDGLEWVKLYNACDSDWDLTGHSLGWAGTSYTTGTADLSGSVPAGGCLIVGGPTSNGSNGSPTIGLDLNFDPDLENSNGTADAVGVFDVAAAQIDDASVPLDAVLYGDANDNMLVDENGDANAAPDIADVTSGESLQQSDVNVWTSGAPVPDECPAFG